MQRKEEGIRIMTIFANYNEKKEAMRYYISTLVFVCFALMAIAQDGNHSFLVEGKSWHGAYILEDDIPTQFQWIVECDSMVNDLDYKVVGRYETGHTKEGFSRVGCYLMREEDKKVYVRLDGFADDWLLYDFGLAEGDEIASDRWDDSRKFRVNKVDTVEVNGQSYRRLFMGAVWDSGDGPLPLNANGEATSFSDIWLEGLGGLEHGGNLLSEKPGFYGSYMVKYNLWYCLQDGELLANYTDWYNAISKVEEYRSKETSQPIFDLFGRIIQSDKNAKRLHKGVYIQNGKKFVVK